MRPELLYPADGPADDRLRDRPADSQRGTYPRSSLALGLVGAAILLVAPALVGPLIGAATAVGLLVAFPIAIWRAEQTLDRLGAIARRSVQTATGAPRD